MTPDPDHTLMRDPLPARERFCVKKIAGADQGRRAPRPRRIPWRAWRDIALRTLWGVFDDRLFALAAGVAFYAVLAIFPALAVSLSLYGLFADASSVAAHLELLADVLPPGAAELLGEQMAPVALAHAPVLGWALAGSSLVSIWSANAGVAALFDALNVVYREKDQRTLIQFYATSLLFTLFAILFAAAAFAAVVVFPVALRFFGWASAERQIISMLRWPVMFALVTFALMLFYRYGPSRAQARWRWVSVGGLVAALLWILVSMAFSRYVASFDGYNRMYGSLGAIMAFMMWLWLSSLVALIGAKIDAETELQTARDTTRGPETAP